MSRIIFVPQYPTELRYQEWWYSQFPQEFERRGFDVLTLGNSYIKSNKDAKHDPEMFSPIKQAIELESVQMDEYMSMKLYKDDILFLSDLSFPGMFPNVLYHKRCKKMFAFCHATSINNFDYFSKVSYSKFTVESGHAKLFDKIFVGSRYHKEKLQSNAIAGYWKNTVVTYLPFSTVPLLRQIPPEKTIDIMSASRPTIQKVDSEIENKLTNEFGFQIKRPQSSTWFNYYWNLASSKILLITANEDTFGYQIIDAIINGCIPLAKNSFAYPELLERKYLYNDVDELKYKIECILNGDESFNNPRILCENQMINFYDRICNEMTKKDYPF